jgi:excisionase family DNA binding protein
MQPLPHELASHSPRLAEPILTTAQVAQWLGCSRRHIHELTRTLAIPHRRLPGGRRCWFKAEELAAWLDGAPLEVQLLPRGGRVVRPTSSGRPRDEEAE